MALPKTRIFIIGFIGLLVLLTIALFIFGSQDRATRETIKLTFWGVDDESAINTIAASFGKQYEIHYRRFDPETYETELVNALAANRGPDIFMVHNSWLPKHYDKMVPVSGEQLSVPAFRSLFPTVVEQDFSPDGVIFALPLYIDTLALYYNKDLFDTKSIARAPATWSEFQTDIPRLRQLDATGKITTAAAAIGGSARNIPAATDLFTTLLLQTIGPTRMVSSDFSRATFSSEGGLPALAFYVKFANPNDPLYTWSESFQNSIDAFAQQRVAMMFDYASQVAVVKEKNPLLRFDVAPLPQPTAAQVAVTVADYWGIAVSRNSSNASGGWSFALSLATIPQVAQQYAAATSRLPALRDLITQRLNDPVWSAFAHQALNARSWPQIDNVRVSTIFSDMIEKVIGGQLTADRALQAAQDAVTNLMQRRNAQF